MAKQGRAPRRWLPREHGFWVMSCAVLVTALTKSGNSIAAWLMAPAVLIASSVLGGLFSRSVRRAQSAQIAASAALAFGGVPVELAAGARAADALLTGVAWAAIFVPSALIVRAAFARAAQQHERAYQLEVCSIALCLAAAAAFMALERVPLTIATGMAAVTCALLSCIEPSVKQMKPVGLTFAGLSALSALLLAL
ncbi:MAG TPA: hypothetical protein VI072_17100 [Polyangiaceae bacterium]